MVTFLRTLVVAALLVALVGAPLPAEAAALGVVTQADRARIGGATALDGTAVFDGDRLETGTAGLLRMRAGRARLSLLAESTAALRQTPGGVTARLERGTVIFSAATPEVFELAASEARMRARAGQPVYAQVTLLGPDEFLVTSQRGALDVTIGEETHTVAEATSYRVVIDPEPQGPRGEGSGRGPRPVHAARSHFLPVALFAIGVTTGILVWRALISPDKP